MGRKEEVCARIREIGILPAIRVHSAEDALFAAGQMLKWGIPVVELTMTVPGALGVIEELARTSPDLIVGAGTVLDAETGHDLDVLGRIAANLNEVLKFLAGDQIGFLGVIHRSHLVDVAFDLHGFRCCSHREFDVHIAFLAARQIDSRQLVGGETFGFHIDLE